MNWWEARRLSAGQLEALAHQTAATAPNRPGPWIALGRMFRHQGHHQRAAELLEEAVARLPADAELHLSLAQAHSALDGFEVALEQVDRTLRLKPGHRRARLLQFALLAKTAQWTQVERLAGDIARLNPLEPTLYDQWARKADTPEGIGHLLERCETALTQGQLCTNAVYFKALALALLGEDEAARETLSVDRFVEISEFPPPEGFATGEAFRAALAMEILRNPTLAPDPRGTATQGGRQARTLRQPDAPAVSSLLGQIKAAVDGYDRRLSSQSSLARVRPATVHLDAWAVVYGAEGQQVPHRHARGWISGVYYVAASRPAGEARYRGSLRLGAILERYRLDPPWGIREIEPVPGRLVLFPSYLPHATEASGIEGARISVAFDVVPAEPG